MDQRLDIMKDNEDVWHNAQGAVNEFGAPFNITEDEECDESHVAMVAPRGISTY